MVESETAEAVACTFLFTDIVGSTALLEAIGNEAWQDLIRWHDRTLRALFAEHGGEEVDHTGDGFFVAFPDPGRGARRRRCHPAHIGQALAHARLRALGAGGSPRG
jgi:class 3 adenylate cyclase